ncbi:PREDICTED: mannose-1-phosphate guanyltransferase alpha-A-like [Acropora digitifera]|uniref:mannose-1-phosphate guanyltransferase alpha-A-like n=1 Tax=Acropora digitifera TaxID=70779 RepID=UPI00077A1FCC|nr:PREDICTED: mannose-1-phosphate guanyltransferase alpha-A-like [Acropora digitifera]
MIKVVILIGGPMKGTRFRPLSLELPKPLFPIGGFPVVYHHIEACVKIPELKEIILIGFYQSSESLSKFISSAQQEFNIPIRYLQEFQPLGTAGGLYHFRDQISMGDPDSFVVLNADMMGDYPLREFVEFHMQHIGEHSVLATEVLSFARNNCFLAIQCFVCYLQVLHYVEKPEAFLSEVINCGIYIFSPTALFKLMHDILQENYHKMRGKLPLEIEMTACPFQFSHYRSAIYANRNVLSSYHKTHPDLLAQNGVNKPHIIGKIKATNLFTRRARKSNLGHSGGRRVLSPLHHPCPSLFVTLSPLPSVKSIGEDRLNGVSKKGFPVDTSKTLSKLMLDFIYIHLQLGPNVSVGSNVNIGAGARVRETILLDGAELKDHCCILYSIIGWNCSIGVWSRVEGSRCDPNPNEEFAKPDGESLFGNDGKLTPSITVLGRNVTIPGEVIVLNSIVLPHKDLSQSYKNEIIL